MSKTSLYVERAIGGDRESLTWLVRHFQPFVEAQVRLRLGPAATSPDREDLAADVWVVALRRMQDLKPRDGRYAPVLVRFLGTTVTNCCNAWLRDRIRRGRHAARPSRGEGDLDRVARETLGVVTRAHNDDLVARVRGCLDQLSDDRRNVLVLRLLEQRDNVEIARLLDIPPNTVAVRYRRALQALRRALPEEAFGEIFGSRARRDSAP